MTELELRHLTLLHENRQRLTTRLAFNNERFEAFVLELRESGASARGIAAALGVSPSSVQLWTKHARQRRSS